MRGKNLLLATLVALMSLLVSCQKDIQIVSELPAVEVANSEDTTVIMATETIGSRDVVSLRALGAETGAVLFGKPNSTNYAFTVKDDVGLLSVSVKFFDRATGAITYNPMTYSNYGFVTWRLTTKLSSNGWFDYRYVYSINKQSISNNVYVLCNTFSKFNTTVPSSIRWPFGADGSSWDTRTVSVNNSNQTWRGGEETKKTSNSIGYGWNTGTHTGVTEKYADDWNRGTGNQDLGAVLHSPLDGEVYATGDYSTSCCGNSKYVSVLQTAPDGKVYRFFFGHMQDISVSAGTKVKAGHTVLGTIGSTGATSPHAHCSMRNHDTNVSIPFYFDAQ